MIARIKKQLLQTVQSTHMGALLLAGLTFGSQIFGLIRDRLLASIIGPGEVLDVYTSAFLVPDTLFTLVGSLVAGAVLIPHFGSYLKEKKFDLFQKEMRILLSVFGVIMIGLIIILFFVMPYLVPMIVGGFGGDLQTRVVFASQLLLLSPLLLGLSQIFGSVTQSKKQFAVYALSPILYNVGIIAGILLLSKSMGETGLVIGVLLGALLHLGAQYFAVRTSNFKFGLTIPQKSDFVFFFRSIAAKSFPRSLALSLIQITSVLLFGAASFAATGSVSLLKFAFVLHTVPLALIGMSYATASFPALVAKRESMSEFIQLFHKALKESLWWSFLAVALCLVLRAYIVRLVLGAGVFDWIDTRVTAAVFGVMVIAILFRTVSQMSLRALYALEKTWSPFVASLFQLIVTAILLFVFQLVPGFFEPFWQVLAYWFDVETIQTVYPLLAIAVAYVVGTAVQAGLVALLLRKEMKKTSEGIKALKTSERFMDKGFVGGIVLAVVVGVISYGVLHGLDSVFGRAETVLGVLLYNGSVFGVNLIFVLTLWRLGYLKGQSELLDVIARKLKIK